MENMKKNKRLEAQGKIILASVILLFTLFSMNFVDSLVVIQSHDQAQTDTASDSMTFGRGVVIKMLQSATLTKVTAYAGSSATSMGLFYLNKTSIYNATLTDDNATFNHELKAGEYYILCNIGQTYSAWHDPASFPYAETYVSFISSVDGDSGFVNQTNVIREVLSITLDSAVFDISLVSPSNNNVSALRNQTFKAQLTPDTYNLTNATLSLWYSNGTLYNTSSNVSLTGNESVNVSIVQTDIPFGSYKWNIQGCMGNGVGANCSSASSNYTLTLGFLIPNTETYNNFTIEKTTELFAMNVSVANSYALSSAIFNYNGTEYNGSFTNYGGGGYYIYRNHAIPDISVSGNATWFWNITMTSGEVYNSTVRSQYVSILQIDNCSTNTIEIFNITMKDEASQDYLNGTTDNSSIKLNIDFYTNPASSTPFAIYSAFFNQTIPTRVCLNSSLNSTSYLIDAQIEYTSNLRAKEFYHLQKYNLNGTSNPKQNITLYDLLTADNQVFKITYKDSSYLPVSDALINIQRKYISEGVFKTVEIPKTDSYGETVGNLVLNDVIYTFTVTKNGVVLGVFNNMRVVCQTPAISECRIDLNSFSSSVPVTNFTLEKDFYFVITHDKTTRTTTATFNVLSGTSSVIVMNVTKEDALGTSICSETVTTSSGTLSCISPASIGNGTIMIKLYKNGELMGQGQISLADTPSVRYGGIVVFLAIFVFLTILGAGMSDNPVFTVIFFMVGVILLFALNLVANNGFIGATATILWLIMAIVLIIIKGGKRQ